MVPMPRMRTIDEAYAELVSQDSRSALTKTALRRLVVSGKLSAVRVGQKYLVNMDILENYLNGGA